MKLVFIIFQISTLLYADTLVKLEVEKVHGQNCTAKASWNSIVSEQILSFTGFTSEAEDQFRTACQVVSTLTPPEGQRVHLKIKDFRGKSVGKGSQVNVSLSRIPMAGQLAEAKIEPKEPGDFSFKESINLNEPREIVSDCGKPTKILTKAGVFYRGKSNPNDLSIEFVNFSVILEPC